jgi:hypothetical protein
VKGPGLGRPGRRTEERQALSHLIEDGPSACGEDGALEDEGKALIGFELDTNWHWDSLTPLSGVSPPIENLV